MAELSTLGAVIHEAQAPLDSWKGTARAATDSIIVRSGLITVDGVLLVAGDVVLDQHAAVSADRGLYIASAGAWSRASSAPEGGNLDGAVVRVMEGTINGDKTFAQNASPCVVGTDAQTWLEQAGGGGAVDSVFTRTGAVVAAAGDYDASLISNDSSVSGTSVKDALETLASSSGLQFTTTLYAVPFVPEVGKINRWDGTLNLVAAFDPGANGDVIGFVNEGSGGSLQLVPDVGAPEYIVGVGLPDVTVKPSGGPIPIVHVFRFNAAQNLWVSEKLFDTVLSLTIGANSVPISTAAGEPNTAGFGVDSVLARKGSGDLAALAFPDDTILGKLTGSDLDVLTADQVRALLRVWPRLTSAVYSGPGSFAAEQNKINRFATENDLTFLFNATPVVGEVAAFKGQATLNTDGNITLDGNGNSLDVGSLQPSITLPAAKLLAVLLFQWDGAAWLLIDGDQSTLALSANANAILIGGVAAPSTVSVTDNSIVGRIDGADIASLTKEQARRLVAERPFTSTLYATSFTAEVGKINRYDGSVVGLVVTFPPGADGDVLAFTAEGGLGGDATLTPDTVAPEYILITGFPALTLLPFTGGLDVFRFNAATSTWLAETAVETILKSTIAPNTFVGSGSTGIAPVAVGERNFVGRRGGSDLGTLSPSQAREMLALCQQVLANGSAISFDAEEGGSNAVLELAQAGHSFDFIPAASGPGGKIIITNPNALFSITTWTVSGGTVKHTGGTPPAFGVGRYVLGWYWDGTDVDVDR